MAALDIDEEYREIVNNTNEENQRVELSPTTSQQLGWFTVICLTLNRTIGTGIFVTPTNVLDGTGSVGASLLLWAVGGLISTCGLLVWLELGLSVPLSKVPGEEGEKSVPRSGGEKNYIEFIFRKPAFLTTCMYGMVFIVLGNLSGNAIALGQYCYEASGVSNNDAPKGGVIGIAIAALTVCVLIHVFSRRGGILLNNCFAVFKVALLLAIIILGFIKAGGVSLGGAPKATENFDTKTSFQSGPRDVASYTQSMILIMYSLSGFKQPFYVLSEVRRPRRTFPSATMTAMAVVVVLFMLVNVAYLCAVSKQVQATHPSNRMATLFLGQVFGNETAQRAMAGLIACSIFGNLLVMTFTAARVKQEIAKEGILPFSLFWATSHTSPWEWLKDRLSSQRRSGTASLNDHLEQNPIPALGLHWISSVVLVAVTSMLAPSVSYNVLVSLYSYVINAGMGFVAAGGLLYLYLAPHRNWRTHCNFRIPLRPFHAVIYFAACAFLLFASFAPPSANSPYTARPKGYPWFIVPTIGQSAWLWGIAWGAGLMLVMRLRRRVLGVTRVPVIAVDGGDWVQRFEVVTHETHVDVGGRAGPPSPMDDVPMAQEPGPAGGFDDDMWQAHPAARYGYRHE